MTMTEDNYITRQNTTALHPLGHALVGLSRDNTRHLLHAASQRTQSRRAEADAIQARLAELNRDVARLFRPKQEALEMLSLRMIVARDDEKSGGSRASKRPEVLVEAPVVVSSFIVVSYCWHYPSWPLPAAAQPIAPGWEISRPMVDAVMALRNNGSIGDRDINSADSPQALHLEAVWLDKLCIDQSSEADKAVHVGAMDVIYRSARRVVILLEDVQLDEAETVAGLAYKGFYQDLCDVVKERGLEGEEKAEFIKGYFPRREVEFCDAANSAAAAGAGDMEGARGAGRDVSGWTVKQLRAAGKRIAVKLLRARWFTRAWCAHESRVAAHGKVNNPLFLCFGSSGTTATASCDPSEQSGAAAVHSFEFRFVHYFALYLCDLPFDPAPDLLLPNSPPEITSTAMFDTTSDPVQLWQLWYQIQRLMPEASESCSAMQHLVSVLSFGCLYKGDLMSIALNTSSIPLVFVGGGQDDGAMAMMMTVEEVIWMFSLLVLAAGDVVPLVADGGKLRLPRRPGDEQRIISWAPRTTQGVLDDVLPIPDPATITSVTREYIELDMLLLASSPSPPSPRAQELADAFIKKHNLDVLAQEYASAADAEIQRKSALMASVIDRIKLGQPGPLHVFVKTWLAHGIDCGRGWVLRFADVMGKASTPGTGWAHGTLGIERDERLVGAAGELLDLLSPDDEDQGKVGKGPDLPRSDGKEDLQASRGAVDDGSDDSLSTVRFLRCILDPRLKFFSPSPRRLPTTNTADSDDEVEDNVDYAFVSSTSNTAYIAVPLAVAHLPAWQKRAWILEPFDPVNDPVERPGDLLPDPARTRIEPGEVLEDVYPVLSSDFADRRRPRDGDERGGTWRLRKRQEIFGNLGWGAAFDNSDSSSSDPGQRQQRVTADGVNVVILRKQKVYGAEDYDWAEMHAEARRLEGDGEEDVSRGLGTDTATKADGLRD